MACWDTVLHNTDAKAALALGLDRADRDMASQRVVETTEAKARMDASLKRRHTQEGRCPDSLQANAV